MKNLIVIILLLFVLSCSNRQSHVNIDILAFSVLDSLEKYSNIDSITIPFKIKRTGYTIDTSSNRKIDENGNPFDIEFCDTIDAFFYKRKINNLHYGLTLKESKIILYQKRNGKWILTDSVDFFSSIIIEQMDLNGNGFYDLRIANKISGESGDLLTCVFLYNPVLKSLKLNSSFGQNNVEYDKENKFVRSWFRGSRGQCSMKWKLLITGNKLIVDSTVAFCISQKDEKNASP